MSAIEPITLASQGPGVTSPIAHTPATLVRPMPSNNCLHTLNISMATVDRLRMRRYFCAGRFTISSCLKR